MSTRENIRLIARTPYFNINLKDCVKSFIGCLVLLSFLKPCTIQSFADFSKVFSAS